MLIGVGAVALLVRKSGLHGWTDFELLLVVLVPACILYGMALGGPRRAGAAPPMAWRSVAMVTAVLLWPVVLFLFLKWVGASTHHVLYDAAVFAATALLAGYGARRSGARYALLLSGLAALVAWLLVWDKILDHPSADTFRWLLVVAAVLLMLAAGAVALAGARGASDLATAGGLTAVLAGIFGIVVAAVQAVALVPLRALPVHLSGTQHLGWDIFLLIVSVALVAFGSRARVRGLGYAGGLGLLAFTISVGAQVTRLGSGRQPTHSLAGWPLVLLILGVAGLAVPFLFSRGSPRTP